MNKNHRTIQSYQAHVAEYIQGTPDSVSGVMKEWLDEVIGGLPKTARILEFGSAFGRDAAYLQALGYSVECSDATSAFVDLLRSKGYKNARLLNAITDDLDGPFDIVLANAVLLHFTRDETKKVLQKVFDSLMHGGVFAFTLKQGEGEKWTKDKLGAPRYFCFWTEEQIRPLIEATGFSEIKVTGDKTTNHATWLQVIARK